MSKHKVYSKQSAIMANGIFQLKPKQPWLLKGFHYIRKPKWCGDFTNWTSFNFVILSTFIL